MIGERSHKFRHWVPELLKRKIEECRDNGGVLQQGIEWNRQSWDRPDLNAVQELVDAIAGVSESAEREPFLLIRRSHVIEFFQRGSLRGGFLAAMIWGHGPIGYGASRVARILASNDDLDVRLASISNASLADDVMQCWDAFKRTSKIRWLGPAFATKFGYFAARAGGAENYPLIADLNTSWAVWHFAGIEQSVELRDSYKEYVDLSRSVEGFTPEEIEWALFAFGQELNRRSSCRHSSIDECRR